MASSKILIAIFLAINLLFFTTVSASSDCVKPKPIPRPKPKPYPPAPGYGSGYATCPIDALKLGVCVDVLGGLLGLVIGTPPKEPCCTLIEGLVDLEAAVCLCTALKANILGINLNVPISLSLLLNVCSKTVPPGWQCP